LKQIKSNAAKETKTVDLNGREERRVPMTRLRAKIAERLIDAQQTAAILTTFNEVDLSKVIRLRKKYQDRFVKQHDVKIGFMSFFVKAATEALKRYPEIKWVEHSRLQMAVSSDQCYQHLS